MTTAWVPLSELAQISMVTDAGRLARLRMSRQHRERPVEIYRGDGGGLMLGDGQHRLFLAREAGAEAIEARYLTRSEQPTFEADEL